MTSQLIPLRTTVSRRMPLYVAVRCVCGAFQAIQSPKSKKFQCRVCGQKQSVRKVYAKSEAAKDVRGVVMRLSMSRAAADAAPCEDFDGDNDVESWEDAEAEPIVPAASKWTGFDDGDGCGRPTHAHTPATSFKRQLHDEDEVCTVCLSGRLYLAVQLWVIDGLRCCECAVYDGGTCTAAWAQETQKTSYQWR